MEKTEISGKGIQWVTDLNASRPIELGEKGTPEGIEPETVVSLFQTAVQKWGDKPAIHAKDANKQWKTWTWKEYNDTAFEVARAMIHLGLKEYDVVSIMGFNCPEWFFALVGAYLAGGIGAGVYTTNNPEACKYQVGHSDTVLVFVENETQLKKFMQVRNDLPKVKAYIQWSGTVPEGVEGVYSWDNFLKLASNVPVSEVEQRIKNQTSERCIQLIYTSGTTGRPKGVMISNDNITWTANNVSSLFGVTSEDCMISYLPLSHIAAMMLDIIAPMKTGLQIYFAQPDALKGSLATTLHEVRPTMFLGVPRVWEKIQEKLLQIGKSKGAIVQFISSQAKAIGLKGSYASIKGEALPWGWWLANKLVFENIHKALGLDRCRLCATAAAPISPETLNYFMSLNIPLYEIYGMSECTGPCSLNLPGKIEITSVGTPIPGTKVEFHNGEIIYKGRHIFMGYLKNDEATAETIDSNGFLHSGDLGRITDKGFIYITGRSKELLITAGGENIAPVLIENELQAALGKLISNVMVIGDKRKFLTCILTLSVKPNPEAPPQTYPLSNRLSGDALEIVKSLGSKAETVEDAQKDPLINNYIKQKIGEANKNAISNAHCVQKYIIAPKDFTIEGDELTPTLKLKRKIVLEKYKNEIEEMYIDTNN